MIVHGIGGTLIQHIKEHRLHTNLTAGDTFFYFTTCGWMMWNWLVSGLASKAHILLYDGNPPIRGQIDCGDWRKARISLFLAPQPNISTPLKTVVFCQLTMLIYQACVAFYQLVHPCHRMDLPLFMRPSSQMSSLLYFRWHRYCVMFCFRLSGTASFGRANSNTRAGDEN